MPTQLNRWTHAVLRIGAGLLFMEHGFQKLFGFFGGIPGGPVPVMSQLGVASMLEIEMLVAFFTAHFPQGGWPIQNQGELALLYASIFCFLAGNGAGPLSLDAWMPIWMARERRHVHDRRERIAA